MDRTTLKDRMALKATCVLVIALFAGSLLGGCSTSANTPVTTVEHFTECLNTQDYEGALECCDSKTQSMVNSMFGLADGVMSLFGMDSDSGSSRELVAWLLSNSTGLNTVLTGENWDLSVHGRDWNVQMIDDAHAQVTGVWAVDAVTSGSPTSQEDTVSFNLVKEGDEWKIDFSQELTSALGDLNSALRGPFSQ